MWTLSRRFLALTALMFWQGGFLFYASVVVPLGQRQLGHLKQGLITRHVTDYLNLAGAVALLVLALDAALTRDPPKLRRRCRWAAWLGLAVLLALLVWLHPKLDELIDLDMNRIRDRATFRAGHRWYLWLSTVQWGFGIVYVLLMLWSWREEDRSDNKLASGGRQPPE